LNSRWPITKKTVNSQADRMEFDNFKAAHINYNKTLAEVLARH